MNMSGPVFVARFIDGQITRMTTYTALAKLDVKRGVRLSRHAYSSRTKKEPPAILEAHFESADGAVLAKYTQEQLTDA
jgi:hypothetical protein